MLAALFFFFGAGVSAVWFHSARKPSTTDGQDHVKLTPATTGLLARLDKPVEVRFYSLLDPNASASLRDFSAHVAHLLMAYQHASNEKLVVSSKTNINPNAAIADGIRGFDLDKGEGSYLGLALSCGGKKETLPHLAPDWESALEADVSRAIQRVTEAADKSVPRPIPENPAVAEEVRREIPNLSTVSTEEAIRTLRENSVKEFTAAISKMNGLVQEAQADLVKAQKQGTKAEQEEGMRRLQKVQADQAEILRQIAADSAARIDALKSLRTDGH